jgi:hypothetical protein
MVPVSATGWDPVLTTASAVRPVSPAPGRIWVRAPAGSPTLARMPPPVEIPSVAAATRPTETSTIVLTVVSPRAFSFRLNARLRYGLRVTLVQSSVRTGPRCPSVSSVSEITASVACGFITTTWSSFSSTAAVPSGRSHRTPVSARHGSAATPVSSPPACSIHPAATKPPKYSTVVDASRARPGTGMTRVDPG